MTIKEKGKNVQTPFPFGSAIPRFENIGFHPGLDKTGLMSKKRIKLGPGDYDAKEFECAYQKNNVSSWDRKREAEEFSKNLGYRNSHILKERIFQNSIGGPGNYDINESVYKKCHASYMLNAGFSRQKRFCEIAKKNYPPPGTYSKDWTKPDCIKKQFTYLPPFEWDGFLDRLRSNEPSYKKPPGHYNPKYQNDINATLRKVVSKRGPYDCFTGPRDDSTIKNHFAPASFKGPLNFFNTYPSEFDKLLTDKRYERRGKFLKEVRFGRVTQRHLLDDPGLIYHDPNSPSPCSYDIDYVRTFTENMFPFNNSSKYARPPIKWLIHPGVGRYNPQPVSCKNKDKHKLNWFFKSKIGRPEFKAVDYSAF